MRYAYRFGALFPHTTFQDLAAYKLVGRDEFPELAEACLRSASDYYGSLSLDLSFRDLLYELQKDQGINLDPPNLQKYMDSFAEFKLTYRGEGSSDNMVYFDCLDSSDHREKLISLFRHLRLPMFSACNNCRSCWACRRQTCCFK
jgi:hypothetical protein